MLQDRNHMHLETRNIKKFNQHAAKGFNFCRDFKINLQYWSFSASLKHG